MFPLYRYVNFSMTLNDVSHLYQSGFSLCSIWKFILWIQRSALVLISCLVSEWSFSCAECVTITGHPCNKQGGGTVAGPARAMTVHNIYFFIAHGLGRPATLYLATKTTLQKPTRPITIACRHVNQFLLLCNPCMIDLMGLCIKVAVLL